MLQYIYRDPNAFNKQPKHFTVIKTSNRTLKYVIEPLCILIMGDWHVLIVYHRRPLDRKILFF